MLAAAFLLLLPSLEAEKKRPLELYGMVGGTVFRDSGFALPGATVVLTPNPDANAPPFKIKSVKMTSDARGEFVFRVPVTAMRYNVRAEAKGFRPEEKPVTIEGETRVDVTFTLAPESK